MDYAVKVDPNDHNATFQLHRRGCRDMKRFVASCAGNSWNARPLDVDPERLLAVEILDCYGAKLGEFADEFNQTFNTPEEVLSYFYGNVYPCCKEDHA